MNEHYHFYYIKDLLGNIRETYVHPKTGYSEEWKQTKGKLINKVFQNGFLGTQIMRPKTQSITWTITIGPPLKIKLI